MNQTNQDIPAFERPTALRVWRGSEQERAFVRAWLAIQEVSRESLQAVALFHAATNAYLNRATHFFAQLSGSEVQSQPEPLQIDDPQARLIESLLGAYLQAGKLVLDSLAREISLVCWHLDEEKKFIHPLHKPRWVSFYTVRQQLLCSEAFRDDPIYLMVRRTTGEGAEPAYRALSHLANVSLVAPLIIGPITPRVEAGSGPSPISQFRVLLPDDPKVEKLTYAQGYEVNETGREILGWLERFVDEVYGALGASLDRLRDSSPWSV